MAVLFEGKNQLITNTKNIRAAQIVIGASNAGYTQSDVDYLCTGGTADVTIINKAIDSLPATGGQIFLLNGTYDINGFIYLNKPNIKFSGCGASTIINAYYANSSTTGLICCRANNLEISNLQITDSAGTNNIYGISIDNKQYIIIKDCIFTNLTGAILIQSAQYCNITSNLIIGRGGASSGIRSVSTSNTNRTIGLNISNNIIGCSGGISLDRGHDNINISSNIIYCVESNGSSVNGITSFGDTGNGFTVNRYINIVSNNIYNSPKAGIYIYSSDDCNIVGNMINSDSSNSTYYGIYIDGSKRTNLTNNAVIYKNGLPSDYVGNKYSIYLNSNSIIKNCKISGNLIMGEDISSQPDSTNLVSNNKYN